MELTSRIAKNYYLIIKSGDYDRDKMLSDIKAAHKRNLMTLEERKYLEGLVERDLVEHSETMVKRIK